MAALGHILLAAGRILLALVEDLEKEDDGLACSASPLAYPWLDAMDVELCGVEEEADNDRDARDSLPEAEHSQFHRDCLDGGDGDYWEAERMGVSC